MTAIHHAIALLRLASDPEKTEAALKRIEEATSRHNAVKSEADGKSAELAKRVAEIGDAEATFAGIRAALDDDFKANEARTEKLSAWERDLNERETQLAAKRDEHAEAVTLATAAHETTVKEAETRLANAQAALDRRAVELARAETSVGQREAAAQALADEVKAKIAAMRKLTA